MGGTQLAMSNTTFPITIDPAPYDPQTTDTLASASHHLLHGIVNDALVAIETKLGYASENNTPSLNSLLVGTATGQSQWLNTLTSFSITTSFLDSNDNTWIGQVPTESAVNYLTIANSITGSAPIVSVAGSDSNISLNLVPKASGKVQDNGSNLIDFRSSFGNFIQSGAVWSTGSGLLGSMTAAVFWINGVQYSQTAINSHTFGASVDTYADYTVGTGIVYNAVSNGAASPALASNSIRLAKIVTGSSTISSITQIGSDTLGNLFAPPGPVYTSKISNPSKFSMYGTGGANCPLSSPAVIALNTIVFDSGANCTSGSSAKFTATIAGFYQFNFGIAHSNSGSYQIQAQLWKNAASAIAFGSDTTAIAAQSTGSKRFQLAVGDYVQLYGVTPQSTLALSATAYQIYMDGALESGD